MATGGVDVLEKNCNRLFGWGKVRRGLFGNIRGEALPASMQVLWWVGRHVIGYLPPLMLGTGTHPVTVMV